MPELPEVETILQDLNPLLKGQTITSLSLNWKQVLENSTEKDFIKACKNKKITSIKRIGKYLIFSLNTHASFSLHLRMSGRVLLATTPTKPSVPLTMEIGFESGIFMQFIDVRHLGKITYFATKAQQSHFFSPKNFGPDPLTNKFTITYVQEKCSISKQPLKIFLLDQSAIAGIGNIYANEILWTAKINPARVSATLNEKEILALFYAIKLILTKAIEKRGTSISDFHDALGVEGEFQHFLSVYDRKGQSCPTCKEEKIQRITIAQRSSFFCPKCQK